MAARQSGRQGKRVFSLRMQMAVAGAGATLLAGFTGVKTAQADDIDTIASRIIGQLQGSVPSTSTVTSLINSMSANGSWSDITYTSTAQTNWSPLTHVQRLEELADYYSTHTGNTTVQAALIKAYDYWWTAIGNSTYPTSSNWFDNDIAGPQQVGDVLVLAKSIFSTTEINQGLNYLNNANGNITSNSGQNIVDESIVEIDEAIVNHSSTGMTTAFNWIGTTTNIVGTGGSGIRQDKAYQFHGPQLYIGGYGHSYIDDVLNISTLATGTQYALTTAQQHLLIDSLLDGSQWFIRGKAIDMFADGRQVTYTSFINSGTSFEGAIQDALSLSTYRSAELQAFLARQNATDSAGKAGTAGANELVGNRYFYSSEAMVNQRAAWYGSVKVTSTRTSQPEEGNNQGLENQFLGDGVNEIMITGNEYSNIQAAWNWYRLPGTTVEQNGNSLTINGVKGTGLAQLNPANDSGGGSFGGTHGTTAYAGGASDGMYGVTGFDYANRFDVKAKKSYFFFNNEEVALGNSITSTSTTAEVDTTLNQCLMTDSSVKYEVSGNSTIQSLALNATAITPANLKWVYQGGVGYIFLTPVSNATIMAQSQTGNWANLNTANSGNVTQNVFTLYINHGTVVNGGSYSYIEVPMTSSAGMDAYVAANPIIMLQNNSTAQAVRQSSLDLTQAAFYAAGSITLDTGGTIAVNNQAAVMFQRASNSIKFTAASPTASALAINMTLSGVTLTGNAFFNNFGNAVAGFNTPSGTFAGSSVGLTFTTNGATDPTLTLSSYDLLTSSTLTMGNIALTGNTTVQTNDAFASMVFSGNVSGGFALNKSGIGTMTLSGNSSFSGGVNISNGFVRVTGIGGLGTGIATVNPGGAIVVGNSIASSITLAGGTMNFTNTPTFAGNITAAPGTTSFVQTDDPIAPTTSVNASFTGLLQGSGNITVLCSTNENSPDGANAFRINAGNGSTFSGNLTLGHNVKGELFGQTAGLTSPGGTGTLVLTAGDAALGGSVNAIGNTTGYSELNLRNNTAGNQTYPNNVVVTGTGLALINPIGSAAAGLSVTVGNLQIGGGQELGTYLAASFSAHPLIFTSVSLNGGTAKISPKTNGFGASNSTGADIYLGNISELVPGSGLSMTGLRTLFLNGSANTFTGGLSAVSGTLVIQPSPVTGTSATSVGLVTGAAPITVSAGASLTATSLNVSNLTINGAAQIRSSTGNVGTSTISSLTLGGGTGNWTGSLDITNNALIIENTSAHATAVSTTLDQVAFGTSHTGGIFSSTLTSDQRLVVLDNAVAGLSTVGGASVDSGSIIVAPTELGDSDLSGTVDLLDLQAVANHWQQHVTGWTQGDFDGNGIIDLIDLQAVANHWQFGVPQGGGSGESLASLIGMIGGSGSAVPEPGSLALMGLGGLLLCRRAKRG